MAHGRLTVIVGCMSSGKTEKAQSLVREALVAKETVTTYKWQNDDRSEGVKSRAHDRGIAAVTVPDAAAMREHFMSSPKPDIVYIDEAEFFDDGLFDVVREMLAAGVSVIATGLNQDFRGEPFGMREGRFLMPLLMAQADEVVTKKAVCLGCGRKKSATRNQRFINGVPAPYDAPLVVVEQEGKDAVETYEARCPDCHSVPDKPVG